MGFQPDSNGRGQRSIPTMSVVEEDSSEDLSCGGDDLLIEQMARDYSAAKGELSQGSCNSGDDLQVGLCIVSPVPHISDDLHDLLLSQKNSAVLPYISDVSTPKCLLNTIHEVLQKTGKPRNDWVVSCVDAPVTPVQKESKVCEGMDGFLIKNPLSYTEWPSLPMVTKIDNTAPGIMSEEQIFLWNHLPAPLDDDVMIADVEVSSGVHDGRNTHAKMRRVHEMASELTKKRNLEGLLKSADKDVFQGGVRVLMKEASILARQMQPSTATLEAGQSY